ncbi:MAG: hypothetical protein K2Q10_06980, partial [Rhodospirillales bacterium]|nr:hypothetical protein [Rhodospirillales bacterium]
DSGRPSLPVSVAIRRTGRFDGLAVALLRIDRLREPLRRLALQDKMTAVLRWQDRSLELSPPRPATGAVVALIRALPLEASPARRKTFDVNGIPFHLDGRMNEAYVVEMLVERLWVNLVLLLAPLPLSFGIVRLLRKGARDRAHMMQSLVDHMEDGMALLGRDGAVVHENEEMRHLHRLSPLLLDYDSAARPIKLEGLFGADGPSLGEPTCSGGERHAWEVHLGDGRHMMVLLTELPDNCGILVVRDITRQVQTQAALEAHNAALEESLRKEHVLHDTQRAFVSMVSHELRTPLAIIDAVAHRLHKRLTVLREERMIEGVGDIRGSVNRLTLLVDRVLSIARYDEGRLDC